MDKDHTWTTRNTKRGYKMITILLVIIILALIGHVLENTNPVEECSFNFSDTRKQFKSKEKSSLS